jgi:hypothetical protein
MLFLIFLLGFITGLISTNKLVIEIKPKEENKENKNGK